MIDALKIQNLEKQLQKRILATSGTYEVIEPNDKIVVGVSGGKDSYCLIYLMNLLRAKLPFDTELCAVHIDLGEPDIDTAPLKKWLNNHRIPVEVVKQDAFNASKKSFIDNLEVSSRQSEIRLSILYTTAEKLGCNKIALGHHREDTLATFMMNLFYSGKLQAMPAKFRTEDEKYDVIRPMIEIPEHDLIALSQMRNFPILPGGICSEHKNQKREEMNQLLTQLDLEHPNLKQTMLTSLKKISDTHLLDMKDRISVY